MHLPSDAITPFTTLPSHHISPNQTLYKSLQSLYKGLSEIRSKNEDTHEYPRSHGHVSRVRIATVSKPRPTFSGVWLVTSTLASASVASGPQNSLLGVCSQNLGCSRRRTTSTTNQPTRLTPQSPLVRQPRCRLLQDFSHVRAVPPLRLAQWGRTSAQLRT